MARGPLVHGSDGLPGRETEGTPGQKTIRPENRGTNANEIWR